LGEKWWYEREEDEGATQFQEGYAACNQFWKGEKMGKGKESIGPF